MRFLKIFSFLVIFNLTNSCQPKLVEVSSADEIVIDIEHVGTRGMLKKYLIVDGSKAIDPPILNTYQVIDKKYYKIVTDIIAFSSAIATFKVETSKSAFENVRILHRTYSELSPTGLEWEDCTITPELLGNPNDQSLSEKHKKRLEKFLPDFTKKTVSCETQESMKFEEIFVVALRSQIPPTESITKINWTLNKKSSASKNGAVLYTLVLTNSGKNDVSEFNFRTTFEDDTKLNSITPSQGACRTSNYGTGWNSAVCHIGKLVKGKSVSIDLESEPSVLQQDFKTPENRNILWNVWGYYKQNINDPAWGVNWISFDPISKLNKFENSNN